MTEKLELKISELKADNAGLLEKMREKCWYMGGMYDDSFCLFCECQKPNHKPSCITQADHPGTRWLKERADNTRQINELRALRTELWELMRNRKLKIPPKGNGSDDSRLVWAVCNLANDLEERAADKKRLEAAEKVVERLNTEREVVREMLNVLKNCDEDESRMALNTIHEAVADDFDGKLERYDATKAADETEDK